MLEYTVESLEQYLSLMQLNPEIDFFRGLSSIEYQLIPSIGRLFKPGNDEALRRFERDIFYDFKRKYSFYTDVRPKNNKEFLFLAQHYGLPTRLLDWTFNPLIALYFACAKNNAKDGIVYHCLPFSRREFNEATDDILAFPELTILMPDMSDVRYRNQNGLFTLQPNPLEEEMLKHARTHYIIPASSKRRIINKLEKIGFGKSYVFPSLDSLTEDILQIYKKQYSAHLK